MNSSSVERVNNDDPISHKDLSQRAKSIPREQRKQILSSFIETELHVYLKELFNAMQPDYDVALTQSSANDLIIVKRDLMTTDVIGVLVKRGNIMSKTLSDVDTLVSIVNKAFEAKLDKEFMMLPNPTELVRTVHINRVFVVLTGTISTRGRTILAKESNVPVHVFDIDWLVEKFTDFYPQVFYEGKVPDYLQSKIQELETKSWHNKENMNLSECFVEPLVRSMDMPIALDDLKIATAIATRRLPFSKLRSIVLSNELVLLVGDPGTGKSAALAKLAIEMLKDSYSSLTRSVKVRQKAQVPVLVPARDILRTEKIDGLLATYFGDEQVAERVAVRVLMIDALDEVPSQRREEVISKAMQFSAQLKCASILTSRKIDILDSSPTGFKKYELLPFEASQALQLFEKIHGKDQLLQTLKGELNRIRFQIPMVPLSLILLLELVEEKSEVPASITELYERYTDFVLGRYDKTKEIEVLFDYTIKKRFLASLAYREFLDKCRLEIPNSDYLLFLRTYAGEYNLDQDYISKFVREIERAGVLQVREEEVVFGHRSFLDYFAAFYMFDKRDELEDIEQLIVERYFNDFWCDTVFFYIGHKKEIGEKLLSKLFSYSSQHQSTLKTNVDKFLIGRLLQAAWHSPTRIKVTGIENAFGLVTDLRQGLSKFTQEKKWKLPGIFCDFLILMLTDHSFRSGFLSNEIKIVFKRELAQNKHSVVLVPLLWAMKPFISYEETKEGVETILEAITETSELNPEEKARSLVMLQVLERGNKQMTKTIQKKIDLIQNKNPGIFNKLLPQRTRGSMPYTRKRAVHK